MKEIPLTQGQVALVDDEDYEELAKFKWYAHYDIGINGFYAKRPTLVVGANKRWAHFVRMHRVIMNAQPGQLVDHQNHDTLDNRKCNLRLTTDQGNAQNAKIRADNTSGTCGVTWDKVHRKWRAQIMVRGKNICLGVFLHLADAVAERQAANMKYGFHPNHGMKVMVPELPTKTKSPSSLLQPDEP